MVRGAEKVKDAAGAAMPQPLTPDPDSQPTVPLGSAKRTRRLLVSAM
jgi:hypothetical protein